MDHGWGARTSQVPESPSNAGSEPQSPRAKTRHGQEGPYKDTHLKEARREAGPPRLDGSTGQGAPGPPPFPPASVFPVLIPQS